MLLSNSGLYLLQGAEFLAAATIIIYAGAIIVTFLFVIMLAQPSGTARYDRLSREPFLACLTGVALAAVLSGAIYYSAVGESKPKEIAAKSFRPEPAAAVVIAERQTGLQPSFPRWAIDSQEPYSHVKGLGVTLMQDHYVSLEVIGVLLLVAVAGAVLIATHRLEPKR